MDPDTITQTLGLQPKRTWKSGEPRKTPKGEPLDGSNANSYWSHPYVTPDDGECSAFLLSAVSALPQHRDFFNRLRAEDADIEFFVGLFSSHNFGETFDHDLLRMLADLKIDLGFDIYPDDDTVT